MTIPRLLAFVLTSTVSLPVVAQGTPPPTSSLETGRTPPATAPAVALESRRKAPVELALSPFFGLLRTVNGRVGTIEGPFLFDTGGGATFLSIKASTALGVTPFGRVTGFRHDGERLDIQRGGPVDLALGDFSRHGEVGLLDFERLFGTATPLVGIVSLETFQSGAITVDLAKNRLIVETAESLAQRILGAKELKVRFERQGGGATLDFTVAIEGKHGPLWFELDCGNVAPVLIAPHAFAELGIEPPTADKTKKAELTIVGLGPVVSEIAAKEMIYDGLLNADFFFRYVVTLDVARGRVWVAPNL